MERFRLTAFSLLILVVGVGCRVGNNVEPAPKEVSVTGYYATSPQELKFCTSTGGCANAAVNLVPAQVAAVMTNPVVLIVQDKATGGGYLAASDESGYALPIYADSTGELSFNGSTARQVLWSDPACTSQLFVFEEGRFTQNSSAGQFQGVPLLGNLAVKIQMLRTIEGDCAATLTEIKSCYESEANCGGADASENAALHSSVQQLFQPYIQAGVLTIEDMVNLTSLSYEVSYQ